MMSFAEIARHARPGLPVAARPQTSMSQTQPHKPAGMAAGSEAAEATSEVWAGLTGFAAANAKCSVGLASLAG